MSGVGKNVITIGRVKFDVFIHLLIDLEINILLNKMFGNIVNDISKQTYQIRGYGKLSERGMD